MRIAIPINVAPSGFPKCRNFACGEVVEDESGEFAIDVFSRKSCVIAMPIEAKERDVRSQARKVRSMYHVSITVPIFLHSHPQEAVGRNGLFLPSAK